MDSGQGLQQAQYRQLLARLGKTISEIGEVLTDCENRLEVVLEHSQPTAEKPKVTTPFSGVCPLENDLHDLCEAADTRLVNLRAILNRIRL